ncbi:hypothetical protein BCR33DRAFT_720566 [Rhizoclosmatium globosum]|uniref:Heterokaryon incompatibility domain-containing protein n=1 Tax=Rhizoclosmatium globosum TaxID=329046 RepID=A0A1Y2BW07_9FUNG|nr:hypothetical protein BCR33DRAFT_720566 [Rhizoclosmatium globosum]|eukprot:ORY38923.1 hypothetical protein BCR33DRAFT_720566 [Rhizoclosmatium globosum]
MGIGSSKEKGRVSLDVSALNCMAKDESEASNVTATPRALDPPDGMASKEANDTVIGQNAATPNTFNCMACVPNKPDSYSISITGNALSPAAEQRGKKALSPHFPHSSIVSLRVWSSATNSFVRIRVGDGVFDDVRLIAVSHTWKGAVDEGTVDLPWNAEAYTATIFRAAASLALSANWPNYYLWLDYLCTDQTNKFETREATFKMAWVYSAADVTLVVLDESLPHTHPDFWSNRVWTLQEETLSKKMIFINRQGCQVETNEREADFETDPSGDTVEEPYYVHTLPMWNGAENIKVAENQGQMPFSKFWPIVQGRYGGWACDRIYASQYCSLIEPKLEIRYDLDYHLVLAAYLQKLIQDKDFSCTGISVDCPVPGWGCTTVFGSTKEWSNFEVDVALGFVGGFGLSEDVVQTDEKGWSKNLSFPKEPVMGLVIDRTVVLAQVQFDSLFQHHISFLDAIQVEGAKTDLQSSLHKLKTKNVAIALFSVYWTLVKFETTIDPASRQYEESVEELLGKLHDYNSTATAYSNNFLMTRLKSGTSGTIEHELFEELQQAIQLQTISEQADAILEIIALLLCGEEYSKDCCQGIYSILLNSKGVWISKEPSPNSKPGEFITIAKFSDIVDDLILYNYAGDSIEEASLVSRYWPAYPALEMRNTPISSRTQTFAAVNNVLTKNKRKSRLWTGVRGLGSKILFKNSYIESFLWCCAELKESGCLHDILPVYEYLYTSIVSLSNIWDGDQPGDEFKAIPKDIGWNIVRGCYDWKEN